MGDEHHLASFPAQGILIREATLRDCADLSMRLREADQREVWALGQTPYEALSGGMGGQWCWTVDWRGLPSLMMGIRPDREFGVIWMLGSSDYRKFRRFFVAESAAWLGRLSQGYRVVGNYVHAGNRKHLRWLSWLGFSLSDPSPMGPHQEPFHLAIKHV